MNHVIEIKRFTKEKKLRIMEAIRENLSNVKEQMDSLEWHEKALQETEHRVSLGKEKIVDWQDAKKNLRKQFE